MPAVAAGEVFQADDGSSLLVSREMGFCDGPAQSCVALGVPRDDS